MFEYDFYPMPKDVVIQMIAPEDVRGKIFLEPSAGSGNILSGWDNFPTVSPVFSRNDGVQSELLRRRIREDSMGLLSEREISEIFQRANKKLREEAAKAAGNAIVPQVAYQIFKNIREIEENKGLV